jgi:hypothetical protein
LFSYVRSLAAFLQPREKIGNLINDHAFCNIHFTIFCGKNEDVVRDIQVFAASADCPKNLIVNPKGFITDEKVIAATIRQADIHITRPGGISTFELDVMRLGSTDVLFHTPESESDETPSLMGLLQWECSNALWYLSRRYPKLGASLQELQDFVGVYQGENQPSMLAGVTGRKLFDDDQDSCSLEREALKKLLQQFIVTDSFLVQHPVFCQAFSKLKRGVSHRMLVSYSRCQNKCFTSFLVRHKVLSDSFQTAFLRNFWTTLVRVRRPALGIVPVGTSNTSSDQLRLSQPLVDQHKETADPRSCQNGLDALEQGTITVCFGPRTPYLLVR